MTFNYYPPVNRGNQFRVLTEAIATPITLEDFKAHLYVYDTEQDTLLDEILFSAQAMVSQYLGEFPMATTCRVDVSNFSPTLLPQRHISSITSVQYYDTENVLQVLPATDYIFDNSTAGPTLRVISDTLPSLSNNYEYPVLITYVAAMEVIPSTILQAIRIVGGEMYQSRSLSTDNNVQQLPLTVQRLLQALRRF